MRLEKFLFCMTLETAGKAIGCIGVFFSGLSVLTIIGVDIYTFVTKYTFSNSIDATIVCCIIFSTSLCTNVLLIEGIRHVSNIVPQTVLILMLFNHFLLNRTNMNKLNLG